MEIMTVIQKNGRILLPAKIRKALGVNPGDAIVLRLDDGVLYIIPLRQAVRMAQEKVREYVPAGTSLVEALILERRAESGRE